MENLPKVLLVSNAKTIYEHSVPLMCYQQDVFIIEKKTALVLFDAVCGKKKSISIKLENMYKAKP